MSRKFKFRLIQSKWLVPHFLWNFDDNSEVLSQISIAVMLVFTESAERNVVNLEVSLLCDIKSLQLLDTTPYIASNAWHWKGKNSLFSFAVDCTYSFYDTVIFSAVFCLWFSLLSMCLFLKRQRNTGKRNKNCMSWLFASDRSQPEV